MVLVCFSFARECASIRNVLLCNALHTYRMPSTTHDTQPQKCCLLVRLKPGGSLRLPFIRSVPRGLYDSCTPATGENLARHGYQAASMGSQSMHPCKTGSLLASQNQRWNRDPKLLPECTEHPHICCSPCCMLVVAKSAGDSKLP